MANKEWADKPQLPEAPPTAQGEREGHAGPAARCTAATSCPKSVGLPKISTSGSEVATNSRRRLSLVVVNTRGMFLSGPVERNASRDNQLRSYGGATSYTTTTGA